MTDFGYTISEEILAILSCETVCKIRSELLAWNEGNIMDLSKEESKCYFELLRVLSKYTG